MKQKILCIIQARTGSTRLPRKVLLKVAKKTILEHVVARVKKAKKINKIIIATTDKKEDNIIERLCDKIGINCFRGSEDDVLDRYYQCSVRYPKYTAILRITSDCPFIDPVIIDKVIDLFVKNNFDYACNTQPETFPDGSDVEVFKKDLLKKAANKARLAPEREHVTQYMRNRKGIKRGNIKAAADFSHMRITLDTKEDLKIVHYLIKNSKPDDGYLDHVALLTKISKYENI